VDHGRVTDGAAVDLVSKSEVVVVEAALERAEEVEVLCRCEVVTKGRTEAGEG
jgi:hypothetical protein